jgi:hypothetical protein
VHEEKETHLRHVDVRLRGRLHVANVRAHRECKVLTLVNANNPIRFLNIIFNNTFDVKFRKKLHSFTIDKILWK